MQPKKHTGKGALGAFILLFFSIPEMQFAISVRALLQELSVWTAGMDWEPSLDSCIQCVDVFTALKGNFRKISTECKGELVETIPSGARSFIILEGLREGWNSYCAIYIWGSVSHFDLPASWALRHQFRKNLWLEWGREVEKLVSWVKNIVWILPLFVFVFFTWIYFFIDLDL